MIMLKKYVVLVLSILSLGICIGPVKSTYALESNDNYKIERNTTKKSVVEVSTEDELISALEDPSVKQVIMINDITISKKENAREVNIAGENKEIIGKSTKDKFILTTSFKDVKFKGHDLSNIKNITIDNVEIYNYYCEIESCTIKNTKIMYTGIKNSTIENSKVAVESLENSKLTNTTITDINSKIIDVDIDNTNLDLKEGEASITVKPYFAGGSVDPSLKLILKNIRIRNKEGHTLKVEGHHLSVGTDVFLEGDIILETNKDEAILLINQNNKLYVNGNLQQIGNTYTIKSEQDEHYNKVYDKNNILSKAKDSSGTGYYNTKQRIGSTPELPKDGKQGWKYENDVWYFYKDGINQKGWQNIYGTWYYFDEFYRMQTGWKNVYGVWYYLENSGAMATGWEKVNETWYYLKDSGAMATGWEKVNGTWYYLENSGTMATGWKKVNETWYYLENSGAMATGWKSIDGTWYYLKDSGGMATGWQMISGKWYYLYNSGAMAKNTVIGGWKINSSGVATKIK